MADYGIKISQPGYDVKNATPEQLVFSSKYKTLKFNSQGSGTVNSASGGGLVTIAHNLGYVPAFLVHVDPGQLGQFYIAPYIPTGIFGTPLVVAYADSTNLYIKAVADISTIIDTYYLSSASNYNESTAEEIEGAGAFTGTWGIGNDSTDSYHYGAVRFINIDLDQSESFTSAQLNLYIANRNGSGQVNMTTWGIDEDNTGAFNSGTAATARAKTTASNNYSATLSAGNYWSFSVSGQISEIIARAGWSNGNALGIMFWDNSSSTGNWYQSAYQSDPNSNLVITRTTTTQTVANYKYTIFKNQLE